MDKIGVVILNYKVKDETLKCLKSVRASSYTNILPIIVDNNSGDNLEDVLNGDEIFIQTGANLGFTGGNNIGIKRALAEGCDWVLVLNPDTQVEKDTIKLLYQAAVDQSAGLVGPKIYFANSQKIWFAGGVFDCLNVLGSHRGVDQADRVEFNEVYQPDYITGAAMMVSKKVFEKIGFFDERYFLYYEDSDFCFRAKRAGFKMLYIPTAIVYHANAKSTGLGSSLQDYYITRNRMLFASKFLPLGTKLALMREAIFRNFTQPVRRKAFFDFLLGKFGKGDY